MYEEIDDEALLKEEVKRLRKLHKIKDLELAVLMNCKKRELKRKPLDEVLQTIEAKISARRTANSIKHPKITIHEVLGIQPVAFDVSLDSRRISYTPSFQRVLSRGDEKLRIDNEIITDTKRLTANQMRNLVAAALKGDWNPDYKAADIEAILSDFIAEVRLQQTQK